jgi:hypothetical protein
MLIKKTTLISAAIALGLAASAASAKKPHPEPALYTVGDLAVQCSCDWIGGTCDVSWTDLASLGVTDVPVSYGADVEFEAEWMDGDVDMEATAEADVDDYSCDGLTCSATVDFALPEYPVDAETSFVAKVKGFETGPDGETSRDFIKDVADCNLP